MAKKCKSCGGGLEEIAFGKYRCPYCGSDYTEGDIAGSGKTTDLETFSLLTKAREAIELDYNFTNSLRFSQSVLEKNPSSQEANWLAMLAENQIAYIANDEGKYTPTFLAPETGSLKESPHYAAFNDDYKRNADEIEGMRVATLEEMKKLKPYDVFISYRQHGQGGEETKESKWAWDLYTELKSDPRTRDLNIFFDQKSLTGSNAGWEPHIFSAIHTAKCMILLGSSLENINSRWVKNEWKRFLAYKKRGEKKEIVVLGSDTVNPLLLDEGLQEKQMICNSAGRWMENILDRVSQACGTKKTAPKPKPAAETKPEPKPKPEPEPQPAYTPPKKSSSSSSGGRISLTKIIIFVILGLSIFIGILGYAIPNCGGDEDTETGSDSGIAVSTTYEGLKLGDTENGYAIVGNDGSLTGSVELPSEHDGKKITLIADGAFDGCASVTSLTVPDTVTQIDAGAFEGLTKLESLTIPFVGKTAEAEKFEAVLGYPFGYEVAKHNYCAGADVVEGKFVDDTPGSGLLISGKTMQYSECESLYTSSSHYTDFYFYSVPDSLTTVTVTKATTVPIAAFRNLAKLEKVEYEEQIATLNGYAFKNCSAFSSFNTAMANTVDLSNVKGAIGDSAFSDCAKFRNITFGNSITSIGEYAFKGFNNMTTLTVPDTVTKIGAGAFEGSGKLTTLTLPFVGKDADPLEQEGYESVLGYIFGYEVAKHNYCPGADVVEGKFVDDTASSSLLISGKTMQYSECESLYTASSHYTDFYFYGVPDTLTTVTVTKATVIPIAAFRNLAKLTKVTYQSEIEELNGYAFKNCTALTKFNTESDRTADLKGSITSLGESAFSGCEGIRNIAFGEDIEKIGEYAFKGLKNMTTLTVPDTVTEIGVGALEGCEKLATLTVPFVGKSEEAEKHEAVLGFIFGYEFNEGKYISGTGEVGKFVDDTASTAVSGKTMQYSECTGLNGTSSHHTKFYFYGVPASLTTITVTKQSTIPTAAFRNLANVTTVNYKQDVTETGTAAFKGCGASNFTKIS